MLQEMIVFGFLAFSFENFRCREQEGKRTTVKFEPEQGGMRLGI